MLIGRGRTVISESIADRQRRILSELVAADEREPARIPAPDYLLPTL